VRRGGRRLRGLVRGTLAAAGVVALLFVAAFVRPDVALGPLRAKYAPPPSRFVAVRGMAVHYRDEGRGAPLVLLHGAGASLHTWDGWAAALRDSVRVIRLDLPGFGLTGPTPDDDYRIAAYVAFVDELLDTLRVPRASLAGNSLGGEIAWRYAAAHPDRVDRLILVDPSGYPVRVPPALVRAVQLPVVRSLLAVATPRWFLARNLRDVYAADARVTPALVDRYYDLARRPGNRLAALGRLTAREPDRWADVRLVRAPTLLMWGAEDRWIPPALADSFARAIPGARVRIYPGAGHLPMEELPGLTAADARRFLLASPADASAQASAGAEAQARAGAGAPRRGSRR
jgi:pimeloyl-ACP methyl ester carboxylesterase